MGVAVVIGYGAGWWLDSKFDTKPILSIVMLLVGVAAAFRSLIRVAMEVKKQEYDNASDTDSDIDSHIDGEEQ